MKWSRSVGMGHTNKCMMKRAYKTVCEQLSIGLWVVGGGLMLWMSLKSAD